MISYLKRAIKASFLVCLLFYIITVPAKAVDDGQVLVNELMVNPTGHENEWIELFNQSTTTSADLSGLWIEIYQLNESETRTYEAKLNLSGTIPKGGLLTFPTYPLTEGQLTPDVSSGLDDEFLPDDGACIKIFSSLNHSVLEFEYGTGSHCNTGDTPIDAEKAVEEGKSINAEMSFDYETTPYSADWISDSSPSKGWEGSPLPSIDEDVLPRVSAMSITTNLSEDYDLSRMDNLYFEHPLHGKISFNNQMNMTDVDVQIWLRDLSTHLDMTTTGTLGLNADDITSLVNTEASLTMYNLGLDNPTIEVYNSDGSRGDDSIVSSLSYNSSTGELSFNANHFTTFKAVESSVLSASSDSAGPPTCGRQPPSNAPNLFRIDTTSSTAKLYFSPVNDHLNHYFISYGFEESPRFGTEFPANLSSGIETRTIKSLAPNTTYYFKIRGGNGCASGPWSDWVMTKTKSVSASKTNQTAKTVEPTSELTKMTKPTQPEETEEEKTEKKEITPTKKPEPTIKTETEATQPIPSPQPEIIKSKGFIQKILDFFKKLFS